MADTTWKDTVMGVQSMDIKWEGMLDMAIDGEEWWSWAALCASHRIH